MKRRIKARLSAMQSAKENETQAAKKIWIALGVMVACLTAVFAGLEISRAINIIAWSNSSPENEEENVYDTWPVTHCTDFVDLDWAKELKEAIEADCDADCQKEGTRWSLVFQFNGITLALLALTYLLLALGARFFTVRIIGACMNCFLTCVHFAAIVTTAVYRFNAKGKLAAICLSPSHYEEGGVPDDPLGSGVLNSDWTFKKDGDLILAIWVCQLFLVFALCCLGSLPLCLAPPLATSKQSLASVQSSLQP